MLQFEIEDGDTPRVYDLTVEPDGRALTLTTSAAIAQIIHEGLTHSPISERSVNRESLRVPEFIPPTQSTWGYGPVAQTVSHLDTVSWIFEIPKDDDWASQRKVTPRALSATLKTLFWLLDFKWDTYDLSQEKAQQLLHPKFMGAEAAPMSGFGLNVVLAPTLIRWIATMPDEFYDRSTAQIMARVTAHIYGRERFGGYSAWFRQPKWINLNVPGNATGLDPENYSNAQDLTKGYSLVSHNLDSAGQQLALLAGLADMHSKARAAGF